MLRILVPYFRGVNALRKVSYVFTYSTSFEKDGGGAQLHNRIATWAFSNAVGAEFHNSPMVKVWHGEGNPELWIRRWNDLFSFPKVERNFAAEEVAELRVLRILLNPWRGRGGRPIQVNVKNPHYFTDVFPSSVHAIRPRIRTAFSLPAGIQMNWTQDVGLHLRVSQPTDTSPVQDRVSDLKVIIRRLALQDSSKRVIVFASPSSSELPSAMLQNFELSTDDAPTAFGKMTKVKELVVGKSSMSYVAGLVSENKVWCPEFWHPPMPDWETL